MWAEAPRASCFPVSKCARETTAGEVASGLPRWVLLDVVSTRNRFLGEPSTAVQRDNALGVGPGKDGRWSWWLIADMYSKCTVIRNRVCQIYSGFGKVMGVPRGVEAVVFP